MQSLRRTEWVYGVPNASIVMAAFLHVAPGGMRFKGHAEILQTDHFEITVLAMSRTIVIRKL